MKPQVQKILTKLGKEKVELANINELVSLLQKGRSDEAEMIDNFLQAKESSKRGIKAAEKHIKNFKEIYLLAIDIEKTARDLGIDVKSIKEWTKARDFLNSNPLMPTEKMIAKMKSLL